MNKTYNSKNPWIWPDSPSRTIGKLLMFIIFPFFTWVASLLEANKKSSFVIFFLFDLLLLWHMTPVDTSGYQDFLGIMERFLRTNLSTNDILEETYKFFTFADDAPKELYQDFLSWFTKIFTRDNYHLHFFFACIPVALSQLNILRRITSDSRSSMSISLFMIIVLVIIPRDIIGVQNPRFTTGFWLCAMSAIAYYTDGNKLIYLAFIILSPVFHSAMWLFVFVFLISLFVPHTKILETLAYLSMPFIFFDTDLFRNLNVDFLPASINTWATNYMSDDVYSQLINKERGGFWWVDSLFTIGQKMIYIYMTIMLIRKNNIVMNNYEASKLYYFYLLLFAFVNFVQFVPELGTRYHGFEKVFCMFIWFKAFYPSHKRVVYSLFIFSSWYIFVRYGYVLGGAFSTNMPPDIFIAPLPYLIYKGFVL